MLWFSLVCRWQWQFFIYPQTFPGLVLHPSQQFYHLSCHHIYLPIFTITCSSAVVFLQFFRGFFSQFLTLLLPLSVSWVNSTHRTIWTHWFSLFLSFFLHLYLFLFTLGKYSKLCRLPGKDFLEVFGGTTASSYHQKFQPQYLFCSMYFLLAHLSQSIIITTNS